MKAYIGKLTDDWVMSCSRLPAISGLSSWSTPNDELKKSIRALGYTITGEKESTVGEAAEMGNLYEGPILYAGSQRLGLGIDMEITERVEASDLPLQGSLDGILRGDGRTITTDSERGIYVYNAESVTLDGPGIAEAKLTSDFPADTPRMTRGPLQCQGLQICTGFKWHAIFTLFRGVELRIFVGATDEAMQAKIYDDVRDFQRRIDLFKRDQVTDWYPALTPNDAANTYDRSEDDLPPIKLSGASNEAALDLIRAKAQRAMIDSRIEELQAQVMDQMGLHTKAIVYAGDEPTAELTWGMTGATKEYTVKARPAARAKSLRIKELRRSE